MWNYYWNMEHTQCRQGISVLTEVQLTEKLECPFCCPCSIPTQTGNVDSGPRILNCDTLISHLSFFHSFISGSFSIPIQSALFQVKFLLPQYICNTATLYCNSLLNIYHDYLDPEVACPNLVNVSATQNKYQMFGRWKTWTNIYYTTQFYYSCLKTRASLCNVPYDVIMLGMMHIVMLTSPLLPESSLPQYLAALICGGTHEQSNTINVYQAQFACVHYQYVWEIWRKTRCSTC